MFEGDNASDIWLSGLKWFSSGEMFERNLGSPLVTRHRMTQQLPLCVPRRFDIARRQRRLVLERGILGTLDLRQQMRRKGRRKDRSSRSMYVSIHDAVYCPFSSASVTRSV